MRRHTRQQHRLQVHRIDHTLAIEFTDGHTRVTTQHVGLEGLDLLRARRLSQLTQVTHQR
jgi:hypothetical protein